MFSLMIVDDERPARELLKMQVDFESHNFCIVAEASNGRDALDQYKALRPDLVIADIQMPIMDGFELIQQILEIKKDQQFIVLSCHEKFAYAQQALKLGVLDYIVKDAVTEESIAGTLKKISTKLQSALDEQSQECAPKYSPRISKVMQYVAQNYARNISLSSIAKEFDIHKVHLARTFKEETKKSVQEYLIEMRVNQAKILLQDSDLLIGDIVFLTGFNNPQNFYSCFKRLTGVSPSDFRHNNALRQKRA